MKTKFLLGILLTTILLSVIMVSAATDFSVTQPAVLTKSNNETTFTITAINNVTVIVPEFADISDDEGHTIVLQQSISAEAVPTLNPHEYDITQGDVATITVSWIDLSPGGTDSEDLALGTFSEAITVEDTSNNDTVDVTLDFISSFCEYGNVQDGDRELKIIKIKDKSSDDDWEWKPLDEIDIDVKVKFESDDEDDDIDAIIKIGIYDTEENDFVDLDDDDDLEREISLDEGDSITETFTIVLPVEDIEDSSDRYKLYVKAYEDGEEENICRDKKDDDYFQDIKIEKESYEVILTEIEVTTPVPCGKEVQVSARAHNIGSHDEDKVKVTLFNNELGLNLDSNVFSLDEGDSDKVFFNFIIPEDATEKTYFLELYTRYKYSKSSENYRKSSDFDTDLKVEGSCQVEKTLDALITADPDQIYEAVAGGEATIKVEIENTGEEEAEFDIVIDNYESWATEKKVSPRSVTLDAGASKEISIYLYVNEDIETSDWQTFTVKALSNSEVIEEKEIELYVEKSEAVSLTGATITGHLRENWFIWVIVVINIILIIAIILVARRIVRAR